MPLAKFLQGQTSGYVLVRIYYDGPAFVPTGHIEIIRADQPDAYVAPLELPFQNTTDMRQLLGRADELAAAEGLSGPFIEYEHVEWDAAWGSEPV